MADKPTENLPEWATTPVSSTVTEPPTAQKTNGWDNGQKVPSSWWNWMWWVTYLYLAWLVDDAAAGTITATSGRKKTYGYRYPTGAPPEWKVWMPPHAGGWTVVDYTEWTMSLGTTPPYVYNPTVGAAPANVIAVYSLDMFWVHQDIATACYIIESIGIIGCANGQTGRVTIRRAKKDGTGAPADVLSVDADVGAAIAETEQASAHTVDPLYNYWLELKIRANPTATDVKIAGVFMRLKKNRVE